jgi:hypothetical protein
MVEAAEIRAHRIATQREFYLKPENYLHYVRDMGFAPDGMWQPHAQGSRRILAWKKPKQLVMWPRGSFKSHCFDAGLCGWEICRDPNIRILIASETYKQAEKHAGLVKSVLESPKHVEIFGVHAKRIGWTSGEFTSAQRDNAGLKEPTVTATGVDQVRTGMHFDLVIMDDIVSQENIRTPEGIEKLHLWFGETLAQLDPGKRLLMIGTRHHFFDQYGRILKNQDLRELFEVWIEAARAPDDDTGKLFFPTRLTHEFLNEQKKLLPALYPAFYLNQPRSSEDQLFRMDQFHVINEHEIPRNLFLTLLTDFASGENKNNDRTCLMVVGLNVYRDAYVMDAQVGRWLPDQAVANALLLYQKWQSRFIKGLTIEKTSHHEWGRAAIRTWSEKLAVRPNVIDIEGRSNETKYQRIQAMQSRFSEGGRLYWSSAIANDSRLWDLIRMEITEFPFSQHDDIPDCLSDIEAERPKGGYYVPSPPPGFNPARVPGMKRYKPSLLDGKYNPARVEELNMDQLLRGKASQVREVDIWAKAGEKLHSGELAKPQETWPF